MAKKQLQNQLRKIKTRESMKKRQEGKATDRLMMTLDPTNSRNQDTSYNMYDDFDLMQEW
jgi:hypothetical protein